jgi:hypothetical protein
MHVRTFGSPAEFRDSQIAFMCNITTNSTRLLTRLKNAKARTSKQNQTVKFSQQNFSCPKIVCKFRHETLNNNFVLCKIEEGENFLLIQRTKLLKQLWFMDVKQELRDILEALCYLSLRRPISNFLFFQLILW